MATDVAFAGDEFVAPRIAPGIRAARGFFPLGICGQALAGVAGVGFGFVFKNVHGRKVVMTAGVAVRGYDLFVLAIGDFARLDVKGAEKYPAQRT